MEIRRACGKEIELAAVVVGEIADLIAALAFVTAAVT
jgi:hypothetical protein